MLFVWGNSRLQFTMISFIFNCYCFRLSLVTLIISVKLLLKFLLSIIAYICLVFVKAIIRFYKFFIANLHNNSLRNIFQSTQSQLKILSHLNTDWNCASYKFEVVKLSLKKVFCTFISDSWRRNVVNGKQRWKLNSNTLASSRFQRRNWR